MSADEKCVSITDIAASKLRGIMVTENRHTSSVRVSLVRTHCMGGKGFTYGLAFEDSATTDDEISEQNGIRLCVDRASANYLRGAEVDYIETLEGGGFTIRNPNTRSKCPCGRHDIFE